MAGSFFPQRGTGDGIYRTHNTWSNNGLQYTLNTTSFTCPTISIGTTSPWPQPSQQQQSFIPPAQLSARSRQSRSGGDTGVGFFGAAFNALEDMLARQDLQHNALTEAIRRQHPQRHQARPHGTEEDDSGDDEDGDLPGELTSGERRGHLDGGRHRRPLPRDWQEHRHENWDQPWQHASNLEHLQPRRSKSNRQQRLYRTEDREPSWAQPRTRPRADVPSMPLQNPNYQGEWNLPSTTQLGEMAEALENAVEVERRAVRSCKQRIASATRERTVSSEHLQSLVNEMRRHEEALKNAANSLDEFKQKLQEEKPSHPPPPPPPPRSRRSEHRRTRTTVEEDGTRSMPQAAYDSSSRTRRHRGALYRALSGFQSGVTFRQTELDDLELWLADVAHPLFFTDTDTFFLAEDNSASSQQKHFRTRTRTRSSSNHNPSSQQIPRPTPLSGTSRAGPPTTVLGPDEARQLYQAYNERWNALPPSSSNIPYPARGLNAVSLNNRDSVWAPHVTSPTSTWSDDTVVQANVQAFFLGAVGLPPRYSEAQSSGKVEMGFDQIRATPAQIKELKEILKKEKTRWHSDRLGRRNGNTGGTNEELQKDERARAVFHAVCELMEILH